MPRYSIKSRCIIEWSTIPFSKIGCITIIMCCNTEAFCRPSLEITSTNLICQQHNKNFGLFSISTKRNKNIQSARKTLLILYPLLFIVARSLNNWSSFEYNSIKSSCFWFALPNWYACSTTAKRFPQNLIKRQEVVQTWSYWRVIILLTIFVLDNQ